MTKGDKVVLGIFGAWVTKTLVDFGIEKYDTLMWRKKCREMTKEEASSEIQLIVAMHKNNVYVLKKELNAKYTDVCKNQYISAETKVFYLNELGSEIEKVEEKVKVSEKMKEENYYKSLEKLQSDLLKFVDKLKAELGKDRC
jgi:hypothetical protein